MPIAANTSSIEEQGAFTKWFSPLWVRDNVHKEHYEGMLVLLWPVELVDVH
jgi:hypothetical protein